MKIEINNAILSKNMQKLFKHIVKTANKYSKFNQKKFEVSINFVSRDEIKELNQKARNIDNATDVLSFPNLTLKPMAKVRYKDFKADINPETHNLMLGDIVICEDVAKENADTYGHSYERELCYLVLHGFLHLIGFDHMTEEDKKIMRALEEAVLNKYKITLEGK